MALNLVAYEDSDNESEEEVEDVEPHVVIKPTVNKPSVSELVTEDKSIEEEAEVPKPSEKELELAELAKREKENITKTSSLSHLGKKKNGKIVISVPSLSELGEDEDEKKSKKAPTIAGTQGSSKLFASLPPPKHAMYKTKQDKAQTVPNQVVRKPVPLIPQSVLKKNSEKKDSDDEIEESFFTLSEPQIPVVEQNEVGPTLPPSQPSYQQNENQYYELHTNEQYNLAASSDIHFAQQETMEIDEAAIEALQGKKRKLPDDAQVIEIREERLTYDPSLSYIKQISEERDNPNSAEFSYNKVQKKKHQITYLAAQAKARELELKNQWAQNRMSRKQTQAKYGF